MHTVRRCENIARRRISAFDENKLFRGDGTRECRHHAHPLDANESSKQNARTRHSLVRDRLAASPPNLLSGLVQRRGGANYTPLPGSLR